MAFDLNSLLVPEHCGILVFECQEGVIGTGSLIPGLAKSVQESGMVANLATLLERGRTAGVRVFYCAVKKRSDGLGNPFNTPLERRLREKGGPEGSVFDAGPIVKELEPQPGDIVIERAHGMSGFYESGLDAFLRNTGVTTVIVAGVSVNVGVMGTTIEAVNHGYSVVVPSDCVAGDPPEYAEQALRYSIRNVAYVTPSSTIFDAWK
jgi:nicotinamidase-related amidase